ncbi:MAG: hypothetical protein GF317_19270 [Candidatus Lokiarchaeota archaeon]|nr:hypothetical protein [Candidatus Lokiarchaeota archaeon]MBD3201639.1 hypothetical protein [Candidatus Lokiarchaeota archaeon]
MSKKDKELKWSSELSERALEFTQPDVMLKLVSTIDERGWPHITMITSNRAINNTEIAWGAFTEGTSKENVKQNPKQGILYMTADMPFKFLQVKADFKFTKKEGEELERFNKSELMRYFTYVRVHTAYFNDLVAARPVRDLSLLGIVGGIVKDIIGKGGLKTDLNEKKLNPLGIKLFSAPIAVRAISYLDPKDGYPIIIPHIPLQAADHNRLVFPLSGLKEDLQAIPEGAKVAVFCMNFDYANQVVKGTYKGMRSSRLIKFGAIDIEEIYNSCPPVTGVIYPEQRAYSRPKVTNFHL